MKRGYIVSGTDAAWGVAVVATTAKEAKKISVAAGEFLDDEWINIKSHWERDVDVNGLHIGVLRDLRKGLFRGFYNYIESKCDNCGVESQVEAYNNKALCFDCMEKEYENVR